MLLYQILYQVFYVLPLISTLLLMIFFKQYFHHPKSHRFLNIAAYFILAFTAFLLLFFPAMISSLATSLIVLACSLIFSKIVILIKR